jgi:hypothetical protein
MLSVTNSAALTSALSDVDRDVDLRVLICRRAFQLHLEGDRPLMDGIRFVVVEGGDTPAVINDAVGFAITGEDAEEPSFEWIEDHGLWFEIAYDRGDGHRTFIFVENNPGTELGIHYLCLSHACHDGEESGQ